MGSVYWAVGEGIYYMFYFTKSDFSLKKNNNASLVILTLWSRSYQREEICRGRNFMNFGERKYPPNNGEKVIHSFLS